MSQRSPDPAVPPQVVPRPASAVPGQRPPWATLSAASRRGLSLPVVHRALERGGQLGEVPPAGDEALWVEVPGIEPLGPPALPAAVLVALFEEDGEARVVLTRRSSELRAHRGEVSFPGGRIDTGETPEVAALREAYEEVALAPSSVTLTGWLHPVLTFASGSLIMPVVGVLDAPPELTPSPSEVERVFDVALADLVADGVFSEERWRVPGRPVPTSADGSFPVWFFEAAGELIWGATARMLFELCCLVLGLDSDP